MPGERGRDRSWWVKGPARNTCASSARGSSDAVASEAKISKFMDREGPGAEEPELTESILVDRLQRLARRLFTVVAFFLRRLPTTSQKSAADKSVPFLMFCLQRLWKSLQAGSDS